MYLPPITSETILIAIFTVGLIVAMYVLESSPQTQFGYSKFAFGKDSKWKLPSFYGMLIIYSPAAVISLMCLVVFTATQGYHTRLLALFNTLHYLKRIAEVLFVHKYSGSVLAFHTCIISLSYASSCSTLTYLASQVPDTVVSQTQVILGSVLFFGAEATNHYHHLILSRLRTQKDDVRYKVPNDGLFRLVWCPHYLGEIVAFISMGLVSQNVLGILFQFTAASYLSARALSTKAWYEQKFPDAPKRSALVPFVF